MSSSALLRAVLLFAATSSLAPLAACSSDSSTAAEPAVSDVVLDGGATESQLRTFLDSPSDTWAWAGGRFESPKAGTVLPSDVPFQFSWRADPTDTAEAGAPDDLQMLYLLVFATPSQSNLLRVFTTESSYTPDATAWQSLVAAGAPLSLSLTTATFAGGAPTADGGPHRGQKLTFTIE